MLVNLRIKYNDMDEVIFEIEVEGYTYDIIPFEFENDETHQQRFMVLLSGVPVYYLTQDENGKWVDSPRLVDEGFDEEYEPSEDRETEDAIGEAIEQHYL